MIVRQLRPDERNFVLDSAWRSILTHPMSEPMAPRHVGLLVGTLLDRWPCLVAADSESDSALGWLLYRDSNTVGWLFTKPWYRRHGFAHALLQHAGISPHPLIAFPTTDRVSGYVPRFRPFLATQELIDHGTSR